MISYSKVETCAIKQDVILNKDMFPNDFMVKLSTIEIDLMVVQNEIPSKSYLGTIQIIINANNIKPIYKT